MYNTGFKRIRKMKNDPLNSLWLGVKRNERYETKDVLSQRFEKSLEDLYGANLDDDWTPGSNIMNGDYVGYGKKMYVQMYMIDIVPFAIVAGYSLVVALVLKFRRGIEIDKDVRDSIYLIR